MKLSQVAIRYWNAKRQYQKKSIHFYSI